MLPDTFCSIAGTSQGGAGFFGRQHFNDSLSSLALQLLRLAAYVVVGPRGATAPPELSVLGCRFPPPHKSSNSRSISLSLSLHSLRTLPFAVCLLEGSADRWRRGFSEFGHQCMDGMQSVCLSSSQPCTDSIQIMNSDTEKTVLTSGKQSRSATTPTAAALQLKQTSGERGRQPGLGVLCPRIDLQPFVECFAPEPASPPFNES